MMYVTEKEVIDEERREWADIALQEYWSYVIGWLSNEEHPGRNFVVFDIHDRGSPVLQTGEAIVVKRWRLILFVLILNDVWMKSAVVSTRSSIEVASTSRFHWEPRRLVRTARDANLSLRDPCWRSSKVFDISSWSIPFTYWIDGFSIGAYNRKHDLREKLVEGWQTYRDRETNRNSNNVTMILENNADMTHKMSEYTQLLSDSIFALAPRGWFFKLTWWWSILIKRYRN